MFNINKYGMVWTSAFVTFSLTKIIEGDGVVAHTACMIGQIMLFFLFMWLQAKQRYGGEDYMAKGQRLYNEEQYAKRVYKKLSIWKKIKKHVKEYFMKMKTMYIYATVVITISYIFDESGEITILTCLGCMALFSMLMTLIYIAAKKKMI